MRRRITAEKSLQPGAMDGAFYSVYTCPRFRHRPSAASWSASFPNSCRLPVHCASTKSQNLWDPHRPVPSETAPPSKALWGCQSIPQPSLEAGQAGEGAQARGGVILERGCPASWPCLGPRAKMDQQPEESLSAAARAYPSTGSTHVVSCSRGHPGITSQQTLPRVRGAELL